MFKVKSLSDLHYNRYSVRDLPEERSLFSRFVDWLFSVEEKRLRAENVSLRTKLLAMTRECEDSGRLGLALLREKDALEVALNDLKSRVDDPSWYDHELILYKNSIKETSDELSKVKKALAAEVVANGRIMEAWSDLLKKA